MIAVQGAADVCRRGILIICARVVGIISKVPLLLGGTNKITLKEKEGTEICPAAAYLSAICQISDGKKS